jgi:CubicO group peptidase (beta-lactamase class C family)
MLRLALVAFFLVPSFVAAQSVIFPRAAPAEADMSAAKLAGIDRVIHEAIERKQLPGAVVLVLRRGKIVFHKAYGQREHGPKGHMMTEDTVFDLASLTKPVVTATCIMLLLEQGLLRLGDPVSQHVPEFNDKQRKITIRHLLLHTSGLIADNSLKDYQEGKEKAWQNILRLQPVVEPGEKFRYSDMNFILLGKVVENVSGETLDVFARKNIFTPLGMKDTTYNPGAELAARAAPTEKKQGKWLQGEVHDPRANLLGGVAGHAGLFSSAGDLAVFCQMLLDGGKFGDKRILGAETVRLLTKAQPVPGGLRTPGWDVDTSYSANRGELFGTEGFGHTGFTGTSLWLDPPSGTAVIFLSNRVHPDGKGNVTRLRNQVATIVAASIESLSAP